MPDPSALGTDPALPTGLRRSTPIPTPPAAPAVSIPTARVRRWIDPGWRSCSGPFIARTVLLWRSASVWVSTLQGEAPRLRASTGSCWISSRCTSAGARSPGMAASSSARKSRGACGSRRRSHLAGVVASAHRRPALGCAHPAAAGVRGPERQRRGAVCRARAVCGFTLCTHRCQRGGRHRTMPRAGWPAAGHRVGRGPRADAGRAAAGGFRGPPAEAAGDQPQPRRAPPPADAARGDGVGSRLPGRT